MEQFERKFFKEIFVEHKEKRLQAAGAIFYILHFFRNTDTKQGKRVG